MGEYEKSDSLCTHTILFVLPILIVYPFSNRLPIITMGNNISTLRAVATVTFICAAKLHELVSNQSNANQEKRADIYRDDATNPNHNPLIRIENLADRSLLAAVTSEKFHKQTKELLQSAGPNLYPRFAYKTGTQADGSETYVPFSVIARVKGTDSKDWQYYVYIKEAVCILQWRPGKIAALTGCMDRADKIEKGLGGWNPTQPVYNLSEFDGSDPTSSPEFEGIPQISQADGDQKKQIDDFRGEWTPLEGMYLLTSAEPMNSLGFHDAAKKAIKEGDGQRFRSFFYLIKKKGTVTEKYQEFKLKERVEGTKRDDWRYVVIINKQYMVLVWGRKGNPVLVPYHEDGSAVEGRLPSGISQISDTAGKPIVGPGEWK